MSQTILFIPIAMLAGMIFHGSAHGGSFAALTPGGLEGDNRHSIIYNARTGDVAVDVPVARELIAIQIESQAGVFTGTPSLDFGCGGVDCDPTTNYIFKSAFLQSFGSFQVGPIATPGLSEMFLANDLTVIGSTGQLGAPEVLESDDFDLIYIPVPEPWSMTLLLVGSLYLLPFGRFRRAPASLTFDPRIAANAGVMQAGEPGETKSASILARSEKRRIP